MRVRQPVHVVYGGAHLFKPDTAARLGRTAIAAAEEYGPISQVFGISDAVAGRVLDKLRHEPVEDYRIDFEDGYGYRSDVEEDTHAVASARALKEGHEAGSLPPFVGMRVKPLTHELRQRSRRTLEIFLRELGGAVPANFVITLPKLTSASEAGELADQLDALEQETGIAKRTIRFEIMIETAQAFQEGNLREFHRSRPGAHLRGSLWRLRLSVEYRGCRNVQDLEHPACDMARHMMQIAYVPAGVWLSDGATNVMPVARERGVAGVHDAWRLHFRHVRHSLRMGFYQGWDLHPAQLVSRYAAVYSFYEEAIGDASARLKNFVDRAAQATLVGQTFDDAATGQGLLNFFLRGINCGALTEEEAQERSGLSHAEITAGSFADIVRARMS